MNTTDYSGWKSKVRHLPAIMLYSCMAVAFLTSQKKIAVNFYRCMVLLPMLLWILFNLRTWWRLLLSSSDATKWFLLYAAWTTLSIAWGDRPHSANNVIGAALSSIVFISLLTYAREYSPWAIRLLPHYLMMLGFISLTLMLISWEGWNTLNRYSFGRGIFFHHTLASYLAATLAFLSIWFLQHTYMKPKHSRLHTLVYFLSFTYSLTALLLSQGRGGMLFFLAATGAFIFSFWPSIQKATKKKLLTGATLTALLIAGICASKAIPDTEHTARDSYASYVDRGLMDRDRIWINGWHAITQSPSTILFGHGATTSSNSTYNSGFTAHHFHNLWMNTAFHSGLIGVLLLSTFIVVALRQGARCNFQQPWVYLALGGLAAALVDVESLLGYPSASMFLVFFPLIMCVISIKTTNTNRNIST